MLETLRALTDKVADPKSEEATTTFICYNEVRSINPEIAVLVGICTHLGVHLNFGPKWRCNLGDDWLGGISVRVTVHHST